MRLWLIALISLPLTAEAQVQLTGLEGEGGVSFTATNLLSDLASFGFVPIMLEVKNDTERDRSWQVRTRASRGWGSRDVALYDRTIEVPRKSSRTFEIIAPFPGVSDRGGLIDLTFTIEGYGVKSGSAYLSGQLSTYLSTAKPFVALSVNLEAKDRDRFVGGSSPILAVKFDPARMPSDWRALVGLDSIWLLPSDLAAISDDAQRALLDWVIQGGHLVVCTGDTDAVAPYGLRIRAEDFGPHGFGELRALAWNGVGITDPVSQLAATLPIREQKTRERPPQPPRITYAAVNRLLMLSFLLLFGLTIGPINLFWLARQKHRGRLLWTTPLISVLASVLLMALILFQDGVGGNGHRTVIAMLMPDQSSEVLYQEQISRTGVLLSTTFPAEEGSFLEPLQIENTLHGTRSFHISRGRHGGEWFTTRSVQAQRLEMVRASRSRVELLGTAPPRIASTLPAPVEKLFYVDEEGARWIARNVRPGDQVALEPAPENEMTEFLDAKVKYTSLFLQYLINGRRSQAGFFFAGGAAPLAIDTLSTISWSDDDVLFLGPVRQVAPR